MKENPSKHPSPVLFVSKVHKSVPRTRGQYASAHHHVCLCVELPLLWGRIPSQALLRGGGGGGLAVGKLKDGLPGFRAEGLGQGLHPKGLERGDVCLGREGEDWGVPNALANFRDGPWQPIALCGAAAVEYDQGVPERGRRRLSLHSGLIHHI